MRQGKRVFGSFGLSLAVHGALVLGLGAVTWHAVRSERSERTAPTVVGMQLEPAEFLSREPVEPPREIEELSEDAFDEPVLVEADPLPEPEPIEREPLEDLVPLLPFEHRDWKLAPPAPPGPATAPPVEPALLPAPSAPVEVAPVLLEAPPPPYPALSIRRGEEGQVTCRMHLNARGEVERVELVESSGHERLDAAALETLQSWRFRPATRDGRPASTTVLHPVIFRLR